MTKITDNLFIGDLEDCKVEGMSIVHACKHPCHKENFGTPDASDPTYLSGEKGNDLFLNMIDPPVPLFKLQMFMVFFDWMQSRRNTPVLIHCNKGQSRSVGLALLEMVRRGEIPGKTFDEARVSFDTLHPGVFQPGNGLETFFRDNWMELFPVEQIEEKPMELTTDNAIGVVKNSALVHFAGFSEIEDKEHKWIKPKPNVFQYRCYEAYEWLDAQGVPIRLVFLKPRQVGSSTVTGHICYHHSRRYRVDGILMADESSRTDKIWEIFNSYPKHDHFTPHWDSSHTSNTERAVFTYNDGQEGLWERDTANDPKAGAAGTRQVAWMSEAGRYSKTGQRQDTKVIGNVLSSLADVPHSLGILESTAEGQGGFFQEAFEGAVTLEERKRGKVGNGWVRVFAGWWEFEEYQLPELPQNADYYDDEDPRWQQFKEREKRGKMLYKWTPAQIAWRRYMIVSKLGKSESQFDQDYPESPEVAFQASGSPRFNIMGVARLKSQALVGHDYGRLGNLVENKNVVTFMPGDQWLWMCEEPRFGLEYLVFIDAMTGQQSEGSAKRDAHACGVLRKGYFSDDKRTWHNTRLVAAIHVDGGCRWDDDILAERALRLSKFYGDCIVIPEANQALGVIRWLADNGAFLWLREKMDELVPGKRHLIPGWLTTPGAAGTRNLWVNAIAEFIREETLDCSFMPAVQEMETFQRGDRGIAEARPGKHDDWVAGLGIGLFLLDNATMMTPPQTWSQFSGSFSSTPGNEDLREKYRGLS
jgi:hypothetical protein